MSYKIRWEIDIDEEEADNAVEAATQALLIMRDPESTATHFTVDDPDGRRTEVDLSP